MDQSEKYRYYTVYVNILHQWYKENSKEKQLSREWQCVIQYVYNGTTRTEIQNYNYKEMSIQN